jgi:bacterioferritin (cytochrome b1)
LCKENVTTDSSDKFQYHLDTLKTDLEKQSLDELNHAKKLGNRMIQLGAMLLNEEPLTLPIA